MLPVLKVDGLDKEAMLPVLEVDGLDKEAVHICDFFDFLKTYDCYKWHNKKHNCKTRQKSLC